ncbi:MAG: DUF3168 domain-containing protein [Pseudomonadales bacterium]|nr:DUF3168 domain-containing protein [Pseudomonadales bacterium]
MESILKGAVEAAVTCPVAWGPHGGDVGMPRVSLWRLTGVPERSMDGRGVTFGRVQVDCFGATFTQAQGIADQVTAALDEFSSGIVERVILATTRDLNEDDAGYAARRILIFEVTWNDTLPS